MFLQTTQLKRARFMSVSYRIQEIDCIASGRAVLLAFEVVIRLWGGMSVCE
jgi:hypothetical protein